MPYGVTERLLHDAQDGVLDRGAQLGYLDPRDNRDAELRLIVPAHLCQGGGQGRALECHGSQLHQHRPHFPASPLKGEFHGLCLPL